MAEPFAGPDPSATPVFSVAGASYAGAPATVASAVAAGRSLRIPRWGVVDIVVMLLLAFILPVVIVSIAMGAGFGRQSPLFLVLIATTPWLGLAGWPWLTTRLQGNGIRIDLGYEFQWIDLAWGAAGGVACFVLATPVALLTQAIFGEFSSAAGDAAVASGAPRWVLAIFALCVAIGAPLVEELAFRGLVFTAVSKHVARTGASVTRVLVTSGLWSTVLFAGIHFEPVRLPVLLTIGAVLSYLRARTGRERALRVGAREVRASAGEGRRPA